MSLGPKSSEWAALAANLDDVEWRLSHLYKIVAKGNDDDDDGLVIQFVPNAAQQKLIDNLWNRNLILKARQLGFSTLVCILWLDTALFSREPVRCGIIAQDREAAEALFRGKVKFAYDNLPPDLLKAMPLAKATQSELEFAHNGSSIRVATSCVQERFIVCMYPSLARYAPSSLTRRMKWLLDQYPQFRLLGCLLLNQRQRAGRRVLQDDRLRHEVTPVWSGFEPKGL